MFYRDYGIAIMKMKGMMAVLFAILTAGFGIGSIYFLWCGMDEALGAKDFLHSENAFYATLCVGIAIGCYLMLTCIIKGDKKLQG